MIWAATAAALTMEVDCGGERHRLGWSAGMVEPIDHPELEAELALVALGGAEPACIALHHLWHDAVADGGFVAEWVDPGRLNPTWLSWLSMALERMRTEGFHEFLRHLAPPRAQRMGQFLHRFPPPWIDRAAAEVSRSAVEDGAPASAHAPLLAQAAANRLRRAFVDAVGGRHLAVGAAALIPLIPVVADGADATPAVAGTLHGPQRGVSLVVGPSWLHQVWAAGAAVIAGHLVVALDGDATAPAGARAQVVTWLGPRPLRPVIEVGTAHHDRSGWRLDPIG